MMEDAGTTYHVNGIDLHVVVAGQGPDVLLVHGFPDCHSVWRKQVPVLVAAGYRVIAPDTRGCGLSAAPGTPSAYAIEHLVADLIGLLDALGVVRVRLVAHDWGAVIAWQLCMRYPERVDRYVALSVGHPAAFARAGIKQKLMSWYIFLFQVPGFAERVMRLAGWRAFRAVTRFPAECPRWIAALERPGRLTAAINYYRANLGRIRTGFGRPVPVSVLGVWSDGDRFLCEEQMLASRDFVAGAWRYQRINGANHWLQLTAADEFNALLRGFLH
jgi:pimeloyl-ACP methyl ester carboxylesterase